MPHFIQLDMGQTWTVSKVVEDGDEDGEISDEWITVGISLRGLTGVDGSDETMYFWALRAFIAELDDKH
jgi:hypothetical protein